MSKAMIYKGREVAVVERNGGWTTILDGMKTIKVRNGELSAPKAHDPVANLEKSKARLSKAKADKPAKAARQPKAKDENAEDNRLIKADLSRYEVVADVKTASGRKAIDIGDEVAKRLRGADLKDVYREAAHATGVPMTQLHAKYDHLNPGMQRMNLGNLIRGAASKAARPGAA